MNIQVYSKNLEITPEIEDYLNKKIGGLNKFLDNILAIKVEVSKTTKHHQHGKIFRAEVNLTLPKKLIRADAEKENLWLAIDEVRNEVQREIKKYKGINKSRTLRRRRLSGE